MTTIISYQKHIDVHVTRELKLPTDTNHQQIGTELATVDGITYVCLPAGASIPADQPVEITSSINQVTITLDLINSISNASPHIRLIRQRVQEMVAEQYSVAEEIKLLRTAPSAEFELYNGYVEQCRQWGRDQKTALGLK